jgi:hypothetical protein
VLSDYEHRFAEHEHDRQSLAFFRARARNRSSFFTITGTISQRAYLFPAPSRAQGELIVAFMRKANIRAIALPLEDETCIQSFVPAIPLSPGPVGGNGV